MHKNMYLCEFEIKSYKAICRSRKENFEVIMKVMATKLRKTKTIVGGMYFIVRHLGNNLHYFSYSLRSLSLVYSKL